MYPEKGIDCLTHFCKLSAIRIALYSFPILIFCGIFLYAEEDNIVFCHIREPEEIDKLKNVLSGMSTIGIDVMTVFIIRGGSIIDTDSVRDSDNPKLISQYPYDRIIYNDGDIAAYDDKVCEFINELLD